MAESFVLPVTNMVQTTVLAEPMAEGEEDLASDFTIEEAPVDGLLTDEASAELSAVVLPPQDRLQMLIEDLSGITGALRKAPADGGAEGEEPVLPESKVVLPESRAALPESGARIALPAPFDPAPALLVPAGTDVPQIDLLPADAPPLHAPASRDVAAAPLDQPVPRIPVASVVRQITDAVVTAREDRIEVALAPEELGRIRMVMTGPDHSPHVLVWAERPEVLDQLRRNAALLQECFGDAGMADASFEFQGDGGTGSGGHPSFPDASRHGFDMSESVSVSLPVAWTPMAISARLDIRI